jgi:hypothetical protein
VCEIIWEEHVNFGVLIWIIEKVNFRLYFFRLYFKLYFLNIFFKLNIVFINSY